MACVALQSVPPDSPCHRWLSVSPRYFVIPLPDFQHKAILYSSSGEGGSPTAGEQLLWWQEFVTMVGHEEWHLWACWLSHWRPMLLRDCRCPCSSRDAFLFPFPRGSTSSAVPHRAAQQLSWARHCCWQGWGRGAAALCCSVNAQLLQSKAAKHHPPPLRFRDSFMLAAHTLNQTTYLLPETLIPNGNSQDSSIQKDWEKKGEVCTVVS